MITHFLLQAAQSVPSGPPPGGESLAWNEVLGEYIKFAGYFLGVGALGYRYLILPRFQMAAESGAVIGRALAATLGALGVLLLLISVLGGLELGAILHHKTFAEALPKNPNRLEFQIGALVVALIGYAIARRTAEKFGWLLAAIGVLAVVLQPLVTSRSISGRVNAIHVLAASTWLGTLTVMLFSGIRALLRAPAGGQSRENAAANIVNAFTPVALTAATLVGLTGVTTAWLHLKHLSNLWESDYGRALIVKLCLVLSVVFMGWWNWKRVKPSLARGSDSVAKLNRSATTEVILGAFVLAATAILVSLPSPR